ncbi:hypothetical protein LTR49_027247 [Elasticomyces elasticus]|nr:hypothetical protein LTR49_027247 [Elasticomyces elasticus]
MFGTKAQERDEEAVKEATKIVTAVSFHPLAITVAGSLIQNRVPSLEGYAGALESQTGLAQNGLLNQNNEQAKYDERGKLKDADASSAEVEAEETPKKKFWRHALKKPWKKDVKENSHDPTDAL